MKKYLLIITVILIGFVACTSGEEDEVTERVCGTYKGKTLYTGERGGCYYYNSNKNKEYVDRSNCNCL